MKSIVMLATVHVYQVPGHSRNSGLEERLDYLSRGFGAEIVMEEWSDKQRESVVRTFATKSGLHCANVGTPDEPQYGTYLGPINHPEYNGTLPHGWNAPEMNEYGPFENQEARENRMAKNVQSEMENYEAGLFILGLAHLHSVFGKLRSLGFKVTAFSWLGLGT
jgi:hypothetical protein